jgi:hypothetical protein
VTTRRPPVLLGRAPEFEVLERILGNVRGGQSAVLVIRGEVGLGKTALLDHCTGRAGLGEGRRALHGRDARHGVHGRKPVERAARGTARQ